MFIRECMKTNVYSISIHATVRQAVQTLVAHHIGLLPVRDEDYRPAGVVGLRDLLHLALPPAVDLLVDVDYFGSFGALEKYQPGSEVLDQPVTVVMRPAVTVTGESGLIRTYALMLRDDLHDIPVVDREGRLIGIASRVDVGATILRSWL